MCTVIVGESESFDKAMKHFCFEVRRAGIIEAARRRQHFESPQEKRKRKQAAAKRRQRRARS